MLVVSSEQEKKPRLRLLSLYDITVGYCTNPEEAEEFRAEVEAAIKTKLLESGVEFKTRIGVVTACHTGPTALGAALMPKFDHI